jgi:hypothetical protein
VWPPGSEEKSSPRTADPRWSPIVDVEPVRVGESPALRVVRRLSYQPGNEVLSGSLLVPLAQGFAELAAIARAGQTGFRESVLMLKRPEGPSTEPKVTFLSQAEYDDPAHDALFAEHPLSLVRGALRWLLADAGLEVTAPAAPPPEGEHVIAAAGCAVILPPRYLFVSREVMPMPPTLASFARVGLGEAPLRLLDVWRLADRLSGRDRGQALRRFAVENTERWVEEGVSDLDQEAEIVAGDGPETAVRTWVRFKVGDKPKVSAMRWRADEDGTVFRVTTSAAPYVPAPAPSPSCSPSWPAPAPSPPGISRPAAAGSTTPTPRGRARAPGLRSPRPRVTSWSPVARSAPRSPASRSRRPRSGPAPPRSRPPPAQRCRSGASPCATPNIPACPPTSGWATPAPAGTSCSLGSPARSRPGRAATSTRSAGALGAAAPRGRAASAST